MTGGGEGGASEPPPGPSKRARVDDDATPRHLRAVEFYCGVGGLHYSLLRARPDAKVVAAFDINPNGNDVYEHNFGVRPSQKNIHGLPVASFDRLDAGLWLLSPPCQPFTRQGHRKDKDDGRSQSFLRLLRDVVPELDKPPTHVLVENVVGFETSETRADAIAVFRILANEGECLVVMDHYRANHFARPRIGGILNRLTILLPVFRRIAIEAPNFLENLVSIRADNRLGLESVANAVSTSPNQARHSIDLAVSRRAPTCV